MSIESGADWDGLNEAAKVARMTLDAASAAVRPGVTTQELDDIASRIFAAHGARSAPAIIYGFPGTILISINDEIVHGVPGIRRIEPCDVVKIDVTVEKDGYIADTARSVIVEPANPVSRRLVACAVAAFEAGLAVARAGIRVNEIGRAVEREVRRHGFSVIEGLSGHGVGRTIHEKPEVPNQYDPTLPDVLTDGLVLTIEPLISAGASGLIQRPDGWTLCTADGSVSAHHEHTIVVTRREPVVLTAA